MSRKNTGSNYQPEVSISDGCGTTARVSMQWHAAGGKHRPNMSEFELKFPHEVSERSVNMLLRKHFGKNANMSVLGLTCYIPMRTSVEKRTAFMAALAAKALPPMRKSKSQ